MLFSLCMAMINSNAQYETTQPVSDTMTFKWPDGKKTAISLTFDDGRYTQIDNAVPLLDKYSVKGTFYLRIHRIPARKEEWKKAIGNGHDIGNHSLYHACTGNFDFSRNKALEDYSIEQLEIELDSASKYIKTELGVNPVSFAYPCGNTHIGRGSALKSYIPLVNMKFETGRTWMQESTNNPELCDLSNLSGIRLDGRSFKEIRELIESPSSQGKWIILVSHETREDLIKGMLVTPLEVLDSICAYALDPLNGIYIDNVHNIAAHIKNQREEKPFREAMPYQNPYLSIEQRVNDLLARMTLEEKIGQMNMPAVYNQRLIQSLPDNYFDLAEGTSDDSGTNLYKKIIACERFTMGTLLEVGPGGGFFAMSNNMFPFEPEHQAEQFNRFQKLAIENTRLGIPLLFSEEGTHGACITGATVFPEGLALGSSWNMQLLDDVYSAAAAEARSVGIHQLYTLVIEPIRDPRMGRNEEAFSEDTYLTSRIAEALVKGCQKDNVSKPDRVVAGLAHFPGQSQGVGGLEFGTMEMSERIFRSVFLPPWEAGIKKAGALGVMVTHPVIDAFGGVPATASERLLTNVLRDELDFKGVLLGEGNSIGTILWKKVASNQQEAGLMALNAGLDVAIAHEPGYMSDLLENVAEGKASLEKIDNAVRNILTQKYRLGLFESPYVEPEYAERINHSKVHQEIALQAAREGIVLLKNENDLLPLDEDISSIAVIGPNAHNERNQLGDYIPKTITHDIITVLEGVRELASENTIIRYVQGCNTINEDLDEIKEAQKLARRSDVAIVVVGEGPDNVGEKRDVANLDLLGKQKDLIRAVYETGTPTIVVLINGRPLSIEWTSENIPAIVEAWNCGEKGGLAVAEVLFGEYNPSGHLAITIPRHVGQLPLYYSHTDQKEFRLSFPEDKKAYKDMSASPLYEFGYGLSYTEFEYSDLSITPTETGPNGFIEVSCKVTNTGPRDGSDVVQLYLNDVISSVETPYLELRGFEKIHLKKGETKSTLFHLSPYDLSLINARMERTVEPGEFEVMIGRSSSDIVLKGNFKIIL